MGRLFPRNRHDATRYMTASKLWHDPARLDTCRFSLGMTARLHNKVIRCVISSRLARKRVPSVRAVLSRPGVIPPPCSPPSPVSLDVHGYLHSLDPHPKQRTPSSRLFGDTAATPEAPRAMYDSASLADLAAAARATLGTYGSGTGPRRLWRA